MPILLISTLTIKLQAVYVAGLDLIIRNGKENLTYPLNSSDFKFEEADFLRRFFIGTTVIVIIRTADGRSKRHGLVLKDDDLLELMQFIRELRG